METLNATAFRAWLIQEAKTGGDSPVVGLAEGCLNDRAFPIGPITPEAFADHVVAGMADQDALMRELCRLTALVTADVFMRMTGPRNPLPF